MKQAAAGWTRNLLKNPHRRKDKNRRVQGMFDAIAPHYDLLNHLLSLNLDKTWRKRAAHMLNLQPGQTVIDLCCGTGDLALLIARQEPELKEVIGIDFSPKMLRLAEKKQQQQTADKNDNRHNPININWLQSDAADLPLSDAAAERMTCAFGIRNLQNTDVGLREWYRVLKPNGCLAILEFSMPKNCFFNYLYQLYFRLVLPVVGSMISKDAYNAYSYLPESVLSYKTDKEMTASLTKAGFQKVNIQKLTFGVVSLITAEKPD